jgi:hypothetical protein
VSAYTCSNNRKDVNDIEAYNILPQSIDGGNWKAFRYANPDEWYKSDDQLEGKQEFCDILKGWSTKFENAAFN